MNLHRRIGLTDIASFLLAIYYFWYQLPFMRATFRTERFKVLFFACFAAGILLLCAARLENCRLRIRITSRMTVLTPVLIYMVFMTICYLFHVDEAARHIRVSFSFWGTLLVYCLFSFDRKAQARFGRYLLVLFLLTVLTSVTAVLTDSSAARAISNASQRAEAVARDYVLMRRNVSGIYLFQNLVVFAPIPMLMLFQRRKPLLSGLALAFIFLALIKASFTIPLFVLLTACILTVLSRRRWLGVFLLFVGVVFLLIFPLDELFYALAAAIDNRYFSARFTEIAIFFRQRSIQGDLQLRLQCYLYSLRTFAAEPLGVGAWYSYIIGEHGIGYHSAILDDLARYGLFAMAFYSVFLSKYYRMLKEQWSKVGLQTAAVLITVAWFLLLMLNIAFRSADESVFMLYILPALPEIILQSRKRTE